MEQDKKYIARDVLNLIYGPNDLRHIVFINAESGAITAETFSADEEEKMFATVAAKNKDGWNIYMQANPVMNRVTKKPQRSDVKQVNVFHIDIDPKTGEEYEPFKDSTFKRLQEYISVGGGRPNIIVKSGGGIQMFWVLEEPLIVNGEIELCEDIKLYNMNIERFFGGDSCHNVDRIMRFPLGINWPNAKKKAKGRKPVEVEILELDSTPHPVEAFKKAIITQAENPGVLKADTAKLEISANVAKITDFEKEVMAVYKVDVRLFEIAMEGKTTEENPKHDGSRSAWVFDFCCNMARAKVPDEIIYSILTDPAYKISESVIEKGRAGKVDAMQSVRLRAQRYTPKTLCSQK